MSGPIVRSGPSKEFTNNWDGIFGGKKSKPKAAAKKKTAKKKTAKKKRGS
ncbi:MAG: hypothetical protein MK364_17490 [Pirellulales bacterium]|nr:hypothetical protein [Pirellulales bacterium]